MENRKHNTISLVDKMFKPPFVFFLYYFSFQYLQISQQHVIFNI